MTCNKRALIDKHKVPKHFHFVQFLTPCTAGNQQLLLIANQLLSLPIHIESNNSEISLELVWYLRQTTKLTSIEEKEHAPT